MLDELTISQNTTEKIYEDTLHPVMSESGKFFGRIMRAINAALAPIDCWILERENHVTRTKKLLENNLKNVDPDKILPPEPYVAVPAIQALSYSMDSEELRTLYANLLSKSIYSETRNLVHPAYTEVIKNLSPLDCRILDKIMQSTTHEIGCYEMRSGTIGDTSYVVLHPYFTEITLGTPQVISASIDNLTRNNLISPKDFQYDDDNMYLPIRETIFYKVLVDLYSSPGSTTELRPYKMSIKSTNFGKAFYDICCTPL